ncbi:MAG TPA: multicopper oxidase family protein [Jatrophihabitans sp.]|jgi:FtsP/CotA-like multicopper oxidase with cupredoxin domain|uniref:multicopper oxidase family protein n=1 Tax=Jatrophihabitans sp. TaxID=1932789 RepID=UPI002E09AD1E|nr:multicopper oxidase family protein [Jatrophihabitans sp.]
MTNTDSSRARRRSRTITGAGLTATALVAALTVAGPASARVGARAVPAARPAPAAAAPRTATTLATPAGKLTTRNCVEGTGTAACDLYAMTGTTTLGLLTTALPIWGFSTTGAAGSATAPGPQLVVQQGDTVSITLHNQLAENVSLALPGQGAVSGGSSGSGDDTAGVATGGTRTYTFTASRAGTFVYEAGHTADGNRQVAMGLAGALIVLPTSGTANGQSYDDEGVLVLSEVDPALNADPAHFDLRSFHPAYRLINGKPFPASDPISTDQGHKVLLRYVNVGSQTHAMGLLGGSQLEVAQDGHDSQYPTTVTAESIEPGATLDTLVTMPTGPESKLTVYEVAQHLDNNDQTTGDPNQLAFGGMMTFLDTNAPAPSSDSVGPVSTHLHVSPNPSDAKSDVTVTADVSDATTGGARVTQAEFVVDDAVTTAAGYGTSMTGDFTAGPGASVAVAGTIPAVPATGQSCTDTPVPVALACLDAGKHRIYVRGLDSNGNWGVVGSVILNLPKTGPQTTNGSADSPTDGASDVAISTTGDDTAAGGAITAAEYFIDNPPADDTVRGEPLQINQSSAVVSEDATIPAATVHALGEGAHHVFVRSKDSLGLWGPTLDVPLNVDLTGPTVDALSIGPNPSNGAVSDATHPGYVYISGEVQDLDASKGAQNLVTNAEAWFDTAPGSKTPGSGLQLIAVDGRMDSQLEQVYGLMTLAQVKGLSDGQHTLYLRGRDNAGNWGTAFPTFFKVDKTAPVSSGVVVSPNPTNGAATVSATVTLTGTQTTAITAAEYFIGTTDPGTGKATGTVVSTPNDNTVVLASIPVSSTPGTYTLNVRVRDLAGNWSKATSTTFQVTRPNRIFATNFEPGDPAFSSTTGTTDGVTDTAAAALSTAWEAASTRGMQVVLPTGTSNAGKAEYRTDTTPAAEATYHTRFVFRPNTLVSGGTSTLTVFQGLTGSGGQAFALQYTRAAGSPTATLSGVLNLNTATRSTAGISIPVGSPTQITIDWTSGTTGSLTVTAGSTSQSATGTRNNSNLRIETARLGAILGFGNASTGTAYFDSFSSGRSSAA